MCNNRSRDVLSVVVSRIPYKFQGLDSQSFYVDNVTTCRSLFLLAGITKKETFRLVPERPPFCRAKGIPEGGLGNVLHLTRSEY